MKRLILASIAMVVGLMTPWSAVAAVAYQGRLSNAPGLALINQAVLYTTARWGSLEDNVTGLVWEVNSPSGAVGLLDSAYTPYIWYDATGMNDGGNADTANGDTYAGGLNDYLEGQGNDEF